MTDIVKVRKDSSSNVVHNIYSSVNPDKTFNFYIEDEKHLVLTESPHGRPFINYPSRPDYYSYQIKTTCSIIEGDYVVEQVGNKWYLDHISVVK